MSAMERQKLAARITTSIIAHDKENQSGAPIPHSGLHVHLPSEDKEPGEEQTD